jgi:DUF2917 family protein
MTTRTKTHAIPSAGGAWELAENATMRLPCDRSAFRVRVVRGTVLVTQKGDEEDHVLEAGDEVVLGAGRLAVAWAFTDAAISVRTVGEGSLVELPASRDDQGRGPRAPDGLAAA